MKTYPIVAAVLFVNQIAASTPTFGQTEQTPFLTSAQVSRFIMDGKPWSAQASDGKRLTITLNRDGTGSAQGPMPFAMSVTWEAKGETICIQTGPGGTKCVRFRRVPGGFEGWNGNLLDLKLTR